jgi:hypothetical protein
MKNMCEVAYLRRCLLYITLWIDESLHANYAFGQIQARQSPSLLVLSQFVIGQAEYIEGNLFPKLLVLSLGAAMYD